MNDSILLSIKQLLGLNPENTPFDLDVMMHINSVFSTLTDLGVGPSAGFMIFDETATWEDLLGQGTRQNQVKIYVWLRTKLLFDPPESPAAFTAMNEQVAEMTWRINARREEEMWTDPDPSPLPDTHPLRDPVIDGGTG